MLQHGVERLRPRVIRTAADRSPQLPDSQLRARVLERMRGIDTSVIRVKTAFFRLPRCPLAITNASWTRDVHM